MAGKDIRNSRYSLQKKIFDDTRGRVSSNNPNSRKYFWEIRSNALKETPPEIMSEDELIANGYKPSGDGYAKQVSGYGEARFRKDRWTILHGWIYGLIE